MVRRALLALVALSGASAASSAPPPPLPPGSWQPEDVGGYPMKRYYSTYPFWLEGQKGVLAEKLVTEIEVDEGYRKREKTLASDFISYDFGKTAAASLWLVCPQGAARIEPQGCHHVWAVAYVQGQAWTSPSRNPIAGWAKESFDAEALAAHLQALGIGPEESIRTSDLDEIYAVFDAPEPVLRQNAVVKTADSRTCEPLREAIAAMRAGVADLPLDIRSLAPEGTWRRPAPHGGWRDDTVLLSLDGGPIELTGRVNALKTLTDPVIEAGEACAG